MASNSLASIMKISGTKANTVWVDDGWTEWSPKPTPEKPKEYLEFNTPPLALVLAMQEAGKESYEIYSTLQGVGKMHGRIDIVPVITTEHQKLAAEIYNYFAKKHTLRRIKGEHVSKYMLAVDELCDNRKKINEEHIKILVSLPRIYNQNRSLERVMKDRKSAKKIENLSFAAWKGQIHFVEKVHVKHSANNEVHYYFSTPRNYLMRIVVKKGEYGETAWDVLSKTGKLHIDSPATFTYNIRGYDFNVLQPSPQAEIKLLD
jgi:hypothetical protein